MMNRAQTSESTFGEAKSVAMAFGMVLTNPSAGCYQLRHNDRGWIYNLYPRRKGASPRVYVDPNHKGPFLRLPANWTLLDAVEVAALAAGSLPRVLS